MDTGLTVRPTLGFAQPGYGRPEPLPTRDAVATILAPSQSISQAADAAAARNDKDAARTPTEPSVSHDVVLDPATREIIYRMVDARSGQVISQVPDAMQLQIAAYTRAVQRGLEHGKTLTEAQAKADLEV